ncbi:MAG: hypothetical protein MUF23_18500, partial [Pirellula sp.]|nr:hypothetical protein [Pirellula sp.]
SRQLGDLRQELKGESEAKMSLESRLESKNRELIQAQERIGGYDDASPKVHCFTSTQRKLSAKSQWTWSCSERTS